MILQYSLSVANDKSLVTGLYVIASMLCIVGNACFASLNHALSGYKACPDKEKGLPGKG